MSRFLFLIFATLLSTAPFGVRAAMPPTAPAAPTLHDGAHDFDFLIGDWQAVLHRLPDRLVGSNRWLHYRGISNHHKLLDSNANFEEFLVTTDDGQRVKGQTMRLYNPDTRQWSIYGLDLDKGQMPLPATIGDFSGNVGTFYDHEPWKGRATLVRYQWFNISPKSARMEQAFSVDGGKTWETNWICELSR